MFMYENISTDQFNERTFYPVQICLQMGIQIMQNQLNFQFFILKFTKLKMQNMICNNNNLQFMHMHIDKQYVVYEKQSFQ